MLGDEEGRSEVPPELLSPGDGATPAADEDEHPLARSAVMESSAKPPRVSFRRRRRADGVVSLRGWWRRAMSRVRSASGALLVKQDLLECFREGVPRTAAIPVRECSGRSRVKGPVPQLCRGAGIPFSPFSGKS